MLRSNNQYKIKIEAKESANLGLPHLLDSVCELNYAIECQSSHILYFPNKNSNVELEFLIFSA